MELSRPQGFTSAILLLPVYVPELVPEGIERLSHRVIGTMVQYSGTGHVVL